MPNIVGVVDGTHIPFGAPDSERSAYFNFKGFSSLNCLVMIDHQFKFNYVLAGKYLFL